MTYTESVGEVTRMKIWRDEGSSVNESLPPQSRVKSPWDEQCPCGLDFHSCRIHLAPGITVDEYVDAEGAVSLERIGIILCVSRERARQIEWRAFRRIAIACKHDPVLREEMNELMGAAFSKRGEAWVKGEEDRAQAKIVRSLEDGAKNTGDIAMDLGLDESAKATDRIALARRLKRMEDAGILSRRRGNCSRELWGLTEKGDEDE